MNFCVTLKAEQLMKSICVVWKSISKLPTLFWRIYEFYWFICNQVSKEIISTWVTFCNDNELIKRITVMRNSGRFHHTLKATLCSCPTSIYLILSSRPAKMVRMLLESLAIKKHWQLAQKMLTCKIQRLISWRLYILIISNFFFFFVNSHICE